MTVSPTPRVGVVGHVEAVAFAVVPRVPQAGEIVHASAGFEAAAGGGAVAAVVLRELAGAATFWTALGDDATGDAALTDLRGRDLDVHAARRPVATRRAFTHLALDGERTITTIGARLAPDGDDDVDATGYDGVYVTAADHAVLARARRARVLVATPRVGATLAGAPVTLDVLVASANDRGEQADVRRWVRPPRARVMTEGAAGGSWHTADGASGRWSASLPPGPAVDAYGCGDAFAGALTFALAAGHPLPDACVLAAHAGAHRLTLRGPYATYS